MRDRSRQERHCVNTFRNVAPGATTRKQISHYHLWQREISGWTNALRTGTHIFLLKFTLLRGAKPRIFLRLTLLFYYASCFGKYIIRALHNLQHTKIFCKPHHHISIFLRVRARMNATRYLFLFSISGLLFDIQMIVSLFKGGLRVLKFGRC